MSYWRRTGHGAEPDAVGVLPAHDGRSGDALRRQLALRLIIFGGEALNFKTLRPWLESMATGSRG